MVINTINISDAQIYFSMVHTPWGHMLQEAPYKTQYYEHLNIGSVPITIYSSLVGNIKEYYSIQDTANNLFSTGSVFENGKYSIKLNQPQDSQLFSLPGTLSSDVENVLFSTVILFGKLNKPAFIDSEDLHYWLRPSINELIKKEDGQYNIEFTDLEMGLFVYFNKSCILSGSQEFDGITYFYNNISVKKGWNLIGLKIHDGSEVFAGPRDVVILDINRKMSYIYIPYW